MNKSILYFTIFFIVTNALSQNTTNFDVYITINHYRELYDPNFKVTDTTSVEYRLSKNDTIISVSKHINIPKGVSFPAFNQDFQIVKYHQEVTNQPAKDSIATKKTLKYWEKPIKVFFSDKISNKVQREFMKFAEDAIETIDQLEIEDVNHIEDANYIIYTFDDFEYESALAKKNYTTFYQFWNGQCQLYKTAVKIDQAVFFNNKLILGKLKSYFIQNLGFFHLSDSLSCESYFSSCYHPDKKLTPLDLALLKYHYSITKPQGKSAIFFEELKEKLNKKGDKRIHFISTKHKK